MIDINLLKELGDGLRSLLNLGKEDAQAVRNQLQDLLRHISQSLHSFIELNKALYPIDRDNFSTESFIPVWFFCAQNFTDPEAARKARSHCTDIRRDLERIEFMLTKVLRTEMGKWDDINKALARFLESEDDFLGVFEDDLKKVGNELQAISRLVGDSPDEAWQRYEALRVDIMADIQGLQEAIRSMTSAEDHVRRLLT